MLDRQTAKRRDTVEPPRVSVVVPSYNHESFVGETISSVLSQTFQDFELIIIDDGSRDGSVEIIQRILDESPNHNIHLKVRENVGLCKTLNEGLAMSRGEFFSYVGSDDVWHPEKLERQLDALVSAGSEFGACYCDCLLIDASGRTVRKLSDWYKYRGGDIYEDLVWNRFMPHSPTNMFWRAAVLHAGGFNEAHAVEDRDLWIRLSRSYKVAYIDSPLASWRDHGTNNGKDLAKMYDYGVAIVDAVIRDDPKCQCFESTLRASLDGSHAYACFAAGFRSDARRLALRSIRKNPLSALPWRVLLSSVTPERVLEFVRSLKGPLKKDSKAYWKRKI